MAYNIIFYFSDQQRWDTCGCFGQPLNVTPNLDKLAEEGVKFDNAFSPQPVCGPCRALFQTGKYPTETGCFRNNLMLPSNIKTLGEYMEKDAGYETAYVGKWHLASDGELEKKPTIDHTITAVPLELRGGYTGYWRAADVLEFTSHGYDGYVFDENNNRIDFKGYRADCINQFALDYLDQYTGEKPFFMTVSQIEPHHQNDHNHYEGPNGSKQRFADFVLPEDLKALGGNAAEEYPDYLGQCASLDENLGKLVEKLKEKGLYENTVILYASDHGSHFKTRNRDAHLNGYDDYKRSCHDGCLHVPLVICGGPFKGGKEVTELVSTESIPKTLLALAGVDVGDKMIGENLLDVVEKKNHNRANEVYAQISESRCGRCIRTADYMYSVYAPGVNGGEAAASDVYADDFLYDMFSVGGGYAAMPLIQSQVVEQHGWLTMQEFTDLITIAEMTPGPIAVNSATFVGLRIAQVPGAIIATLGCITPALFFVSLLSYIYRKYKDISLLQSVLACLRPVIVALIFGAGLSILSMVVFGESAKTLANVDWIGIGSFASAFFVLRKLKWNPILTMCLCGVAGLGLHILLGI